jgi:hypothetical protein
MRRVSKVYFVRPCKKHVSNYVLNYNSHNLLDLLIPFIVHLQKLVLLFKIYLLFTI